MPLDPMKASGRPHSFPKHLRLLGRNEFRRVYDEGQRRSARLCTLFFRANSLPRSRLGITVPGAAGNAVLRNRVKRRLREIFRLNQASIPAGWDIVLNPRRSVADAPFPTLVQELLRLFHSIPPTGRAQPKAEQ